MTVDQKALDQFGEILMREVRDQAIAVWDGILERRANGALAKAAYQKLAQLRDQDTEVLRG